MPIRPENRARYPRDWQEISLRIRMERAAGRCECRGECGHDHAEERLEIHRAVRAPAAMIAGRDLAHCLATHRRSHPITGSQVILTVAHLNHTPEDCRDENLRAFCQRCHLAYDAQHHAETRLASRRLALAEQMEPLWEETL